MWTQTFKSTVQYIIAQKSETNTNLAKYLQDLYIENRKTYGKNQSSI